MPCVGVQAPHQLDHVFGLGIAHAGGRLVEQQEARPQRESHPDFDHALIAVRQLADQMTGLTGQIEHLDDLIGAPVKRAAARGGDERPAVHPRGRFDADADVFEHVQVRKDFGDLKRPDDAAGDPPHHRPTRDIVSGEPDLAGGRRQQPADQIEERRLAGAVRADHRAKLALVHGE